VNLTCLGGEAAPFVLPLSSFRVGSVLAEAFRTCTAGRSRASGLNERGEGFNRAKDLDILKEEAIRSEVDRENQRREREGHLSDL
jgi:hypothetical protein